MDTLPQVKVAVVQASPALFDREATVEKTRRLTAEVAAQGAQLVLFPEAFIPAYPRGLGFGTVVGGRRQGGRLTWQRYWANAVEVPGPDTEALGQAARQAGAYLAVGVIERDAEFSRGTLYCTLLYFGPDGRFLGQAPQAQADRRRAADLGGGRRQRPDRARHRAGQDRRADLRLTWMWWATTPGRTCSSFSSTSGRPPMPERRGWESGMTAP